MEKGVLRQVLITLLVLIALILVLAIIFYQFLPTNKIVPVKVTEYKTPESVSQEINDNTSEQEFRSVNELLEITDSDLSKYKSTKSYNPGKSDPFSEVEEDPTGAVDISSTGSKSSTSTSTEDKNTTDNYYKASGLDKGSK